MYWQREIQIKRKIAKMNRDLEEMEIQIKKNKERERKRKRKRDTEIKT